MTDDTDRGTFEVIPAGPPGAAASDRRSGEATDYQPQGSHFVTPTPPLGSSSGRDVFQGATSDPDASREENRG